MNTRRITAAAVTIAAAGALAACGATDSAHTAATPTSTAPHAHDASSAPGGNVQPAAAHTDPAAEVADTYRQMTSGSLADLKTHMTDECRRMVTDFIDSGMGTFTPNSIAGVVDVTVNGNTATVVARKQDGSTDTDHLVRRDGEWLATCPDVAKAHAMLFGG